MSNIGKITNAQLKEIRKQVANGLTPDVLKQLADKYGYEVIISTFVSSVAVENIQ